MSETYPVAPKLPPGWLRAGGSAFVVFHFFALGMLVLAAQSGPWPLPIPMPPYSSTADGPKFALAVNNVLSPYYLDPLRMSHNYRFMTNRPEVAGVYLEVRYQGKTMKLPADDANPWVRFRQRLLVAALADDEPLQLPQGDRVGPKDNSFLEVDVWVRGTPNAAEPSAEVKEPGKEAQPKVERNLKHLSMLELNAAEPLFRPRSWPLLLARSYARHLCQREGVEAVTLVRRTREVVIPGFLYVPEPPGSFDELVANFGELRREP